ncbi:ATP-binding protein [Campylobacter sp. VBCF_06 NA8]|uniref:ATP-binding protein n=1 Tax=Campylobacter sp. VBCF_06 NA8 TaxID=2983822 RepID=UPI0022E9EC50|nr:ATP-binding protein [Campylobacter sp. VBCF_06 NA8]MDA3045593.1 ATP-binding protein [Campylobacter sp. VBCF_06 NA8]
MQEEVSPNVANFVKSLRDIGYTFEVAIADIIDNSISASANEIKIYAVEKPKPIVCILDNGAGMNEFELKEAMRLSSKDPYIQREQNALGKFGLGLKTASFSQCKKLTVVSKQDEKIYAKCWDLDYISKENKWLLLTVDVDKFDKELDEIYSDFLKNKSATLVIWENIDKISDFTEQLQVLRDHLALVFHNFLENNVIGRKKMQIYLNDNLIQPFNPFNQNNYATYTKSPEIIQHGGKKIKITPFILPHHSKVSQSEWEKYGGREGYIKSQGFYLYRADRLLVHGQWWGLIKPSDATKLVRIKIEISNDQDDFWNIDVKKSIANPQGDLKNKLKSIVKHSIEDGRKPFSIRGRKINDKSVIRFWDLIKEDSRSHFAINKNNPVYLKLLNLLDDESKKILQIYLKQLEAYIPLEAIQAELQQNPFKFKQKQIISDEEKQQILECLKALGLNDEEIKKIEIFKKNKELFDE